MALVNRVAQRSQRRYGAAALSIALLASGCSALLDSDEVRFASPEAPSAPRTEGEEPQGDVSERAGHSMHGADGGGATVMDAGRADSGTMVRPPDPPRQAPDAQPNPAPSDSGAPPPPASMQDAAPDAEPEPPPPPEPGSPLSPDLIMTSLHVMR